MFPIGFDDSVDFIRAVARHYKKEEIGEEIIEIEKEKYYDSINSLKPKLKGKRLMIVSYNHQIEWVIRTALDLEMEIVKVGLLNFSQDMFNGSPYENQVGEWETDYTQEKRRADVNRLKPDLVLSKYNGSDLDDAPLHDVISLTPTGGFMSGIEQAERWLQLFQEQVKEGWRSDEILFKEYTTR